MEITVDIANMALAHLGQSAVVQSVAPPDESRAAGLSVQFWPSVVGTLLEAHPWNFATRTAPLALLTETRPGWAHCYAPPSDCARVWRVSGDEGMGCAEPFEIQAGVSGTPPSVICTNTATGFVRYTKTNLVPQTMPAQLRLAASYHLAALLAGALIKGDTGAKAGQAMLQLGRAHAQMAAAYDANQQQDAGPYVPSSIRARA